MENGSYKRRRLDSENYEQPPPKAAKLDAAKPAADFAAEEENDLNNAGWQLHNLREPEEFFAHVQNQWRPNTMNNPHKNLTFRFNKTSFVKTGFNLRGNDSHFVPSETVYAQRIGTIQQSLGTMQQEIHTLMRKYRRGTFIDQQRLDYLLNYRNQLRNNLHRLQCSKDSANSLFCAYYAPIFGRDGNQITTFQQSETEHLVAVLNSLRNFYNKPS